MKLPGDGKFDQKICRGGWDLTGFSKFLPGLPWGLQRFELIEAQPKFQMGKKLWTHEGMGEGGHNFGISQLIKTKLGTLAKL